MSFCSFRRIFHPTKEERIRDLELLIRLHEKSIGQCSTCINHEESLMPEFVTDYGECKKKAPWFVAKVVPPDGKALSCPFYEENIEYVELLKHAIKVLKTEYPCPQKDERIPFKYSIKGNGTVLTGKILAKPDVKDDEIRKMIMDDLEIDYEVDFGKE